MSLSDVDFLRPQRQPLAGWWILAVGALSLAAALLFAQRCRAERETAEQREQAFEVARRARPKAAKPTPPSLAQRRLSQARAEMKKPWMATLASVEFATHAPVYLLALNIDPATGVLRMEGEAATFEQVVDYVSTLEAQPALASAMLTSHGDVATTIGAAQGGKAVVRFSAVSRWRLP